MRLMEEENSKDNGEIIFVRPLLDFMVLKKLPKQGNIITLDTDKNTQADIFEVLAVGPGHHANDGKIITPSVVHGDKVMIVGNIFEFNYQSKKYVLAQARSVIAVVA